MSRALVDLAGIEPAPLQCECSVLPLNYRPVGLLGIEPTSVLHAPTKNTDTHPAFFFRNSVGAPRIELGFYAPEAYVMPLYHAPVEFLMASVLPVYYSPKRIYMMRVQPEGLEPSTPPV